MACCNIPGHKVLSCKEYDDLIKERDSLKDSVEGSTGVIKKVKVKPKSKLFSPIPVNCTE